MAGGGIKINNNSIRGGADGITYTPRIGADGLLYFDPNRRGYNSIGGFVIKGEDGRDGVDGLPGRDGAKGEKGATGAKLVEMVPDPANTGDGNKYTMHFDDGTVAEFVAPRGEKGDQGEKGEKGDPGEKGEKGADGKDAEIIPTLAGNEPDKAPSVQAVNEGLDRKLDKIETAYTYMRAYVVDKDGTAKMVSVTDAVAGDVIVQRKVGGQIWVPEDPNYKNSATSKKYVDDTAAAIRAELGKQVFTVSQGSYSHLGWYVPNGALPNFYLETTLFEYSYEVDGVYGENFAKANFTQLTFLGENNNVLGTENATPQTFYKMPSGTVEIRSNAIELASEASRNPPWDSTGLILPDLKFQVKVGT